MVESIIYQNGISIIALSKGITDQGLIRRCDDIPLKDKVMRGLGKAMQGAK